MRKIAMLIAVLCISTVSVFAQTQVKGRVTDKDGAPLSGVSVKVKGSDAGTSTGADGTYQLSDVKSGAVLVFTSAGFESKEMKAADNLTISLVQDVRALNEVVVTALGVSRKAKDLGYSVSTINNKTLIQAKSVNIAQALNGKVSGLNISTVNSGVTEDAKINIRGIRSLTGNNNPMLVVDGAPTPLGYLSSIPPDDVQSLSVLKSAASAAVYGPDAVNGVIVITTKRGGKRPVISLTSTFQTTKVSFFPKLQDRFGAGAGEVFDQYGNYGYVPYENQQYGPAFDGSIQDIGVKLEDGSIQRGPYSNARFDDRKKFWNTGFTLQNSISVSGEDFYFSADHAKINGLVPDDVNNRTSLRFNGGKKYNNFSIDYGINYILQNTNTVSESSFQNSFPGAYNGGLFFLILQTPSNVPLLDYKDLNSKYGQFSNYYNEYAVNPYWLIKNIRNKGRQDDLIGNVSANYQFVPWLKGTVRLSSNLTFNNAKTTNAPVVVSDWAHANRAPTTYTNRPGIVFEDQSYTSRINFEYFVSGNHDVSKDFGIKYLLGGSVRQNRSKDVAVGGNNLVVPFLYNVSVKSGDASVPGTTFNYDAQSRLLSAFGTFGINYKEWANVEFTGRNDWDSRLSANNRSFFYPAVNASIVLSDAISSLHGGNFLSYLKLRGAISKSGNVNLGSNLLANLTFGAYSLNSTYSQPLGFPYGTTAGFTADNTIPSASLKPEFVNTKEVGIEASFLKNRINVEATYFYQNNTDQVISISRSGTTGYTTALANAADFKNYGVEMDLGLTPLINIGRGRIDLKVNATYNNNEVTSTLDNAKVVVGGSASFIQNSVSSPTVNNIAQVGLPAFAFQLTDYARDPATGKVIVDPVTGYPTQAAELVTKGRSLPLWVIGVSPSFSLGNFSLAMTWDYKGGHDFYSGLGSDADFAGISARSAEYGRQRFVFPNSVINIGTAESPKYVDNTSVQVQDGNSGFWTSATANTAIATNYFASAKAIRLREVNISYNFPSRLLGNGKVIKKLTVSLVAKNLFLFVPKSNQWGDPEFNYTATGNTFGLGSSFQSPASRLFGGSVNVQF
jgi:TonB-linked SusC/RagA family outer membrane protein